MPTPPQTAVQLPSDRDRSGRDLGTAELAALREVIDSGHLNSTGGQYVTRFESDFATVMGSPHAIACASGTAAVHSAIASLDLRAGDEVITTPITDMGAILPIVYEGCVPVFADVDATTCNITAATIRERLSARSRAIIVTHLFGMPAEMGAILELARDHELTVVEDCAQAFLASDSGRMVGSFGDLACYSFQQGKHMTTGEGGMVTTADPQRADAVRRFVNKGWGYGDAKPDHNRPGLNYRLTELQAAVGVAQLGKLRSVVERRQQRAAELTASLAELAGLGLPVAPPGSEHAYWRYALRLDPTQFADTDQFGSHLGGLGVHNAPRYVRKLAFECEVFRDPQRFAALNGAFAASDRKQAGYDPSEYPGSHAALRALIVLPWNEHYSSAHVNFIAESITNAHQALCIDAC